MEEMIKIPKRLYDELLEELGIIRDQELIEAIKESDEAETKFFRCTKCKHTWREYR